MPHLKRALLLAKIRDFNKANPELAITSRGLQQSVKNHYGPAGPLSHPELPRRPYPQETGTFTHDLSSGTWHFRKCN